MIRSLPLQSLEPAQRIELEYNWELLVDPSARLQIAEVASSLDWRGARVGLSWNAQFPDLRNYMGAAWYRTRFELPTFRDVQHVLLKFGAVDYFCEVFVNGRPIGTHEGGYTPFSFEITSAVHHGSNELVVHVIDPPMDEEQNRALFPSMMYNEIPHGKQNWYVQNSGIWQGVRIELCPSIYIERLDATPGDDGKFEIEARLAGVGLLAHEGSFAAETELHASVHDNSGRCVFESSQKLDSTPLVRITGNISNVLLWAPETPALYVLEVWLSGAVQYHRRTRFGFRKFEAREGKLYLNSHPFYMRAALDQDFYPETVHTPTSVEYVREMMVKAKRLGINMLRCHLKVAHPVYLDVADEVGMLIWTELPSWSDSWFPSDHFSTMAAVRTDKMFWEILIRDWNHPCIVLQTIMNESWGINLKDAFQREWLRTTFNRVKALLAPLGRLVVDNSPCEGNFHIKTDIEDFHQYYSMPDHAIKWDTWLAELSARPEWTFSPYGDAERTGQEPLLVSEFGNWGLPKLPEELPWWFQVSFGDREVTRPAGVLERFHEYGFDGLFATFNDLAEETQRHQFMSLKYEIESIRAHASLNGYVITGITDVHWEANGLLDMWRNEKVYARELGTLQQPDLIICKFASHCFQSGEHVRVPIMISHYSVANFSGARVRWSTDSGTSGQFVLPANIARGSVTSLQEIEFELPHVDRAQRERLEIEVRLGNGQRIAENSYDLFVLPTPASQKTVPLVLQGDAFDDMETRLENAGYDLSQGTQAKAVMLAREYDSTVAERLQEGGSVLLFADSEFAFPPEWPLKVTLRAGSELDGRWFSNFNWIRMTEEPFSSLAFTRILGFESARVVPHYVIQNIASENFNDVLSGITLGWLNKNSALMAQMRVGPGKLIVTTYRFNDYGSDVYTTHLLDSLIRYIASQQCHPEFGLPVTTTMASRS